MPRKTKSKGEESGGKPSWMLAAEERLNLAEAEKVRNRDSGKATKSKSENKSKDSSLLSSVHTQKNNETIASKPGWMLAAEVRLEEEEAEKESKRKHNKQGSLKGLRTDHEIVDNNVAKIEHDDTSTEIDNKRLTKAAIEDWFTLPKDEENEIEMKHKVELQKLHDKIKLKQSEFDDFGNVPIDTSIEDMEMDQILQESELRQKKFLDLIKDTKQRMRESCELASVTREEYINSRSQVPKVSTFTTSLSSDEEEDANEEEDEQANDLEQMEDYWGIDTNNDSKISMSSKATHRKTITDENKNRLPFEEMKANFFNNLDRLAKEVSSAKEDHLKTLGDIHQQDLRKLRGAQ